jgi:putative hydrolase of the HAD superfamily
MRVVAVGGFVASGKSTLARALAKRLGATHIEADRVRRRVLVRDHEGDPIEGLMPGIESETYAELLRLAAQEIDACRPVVLDACFPRRDERRAVWELARSHGWTFLFVECRAPRESVRERLVARDREAGRAGWQEIHDSLASRFEPADARDSFAQLQVSGAGPVEVAVDTVVAALGRLSDGGSVPTLRPRPRAVTFDCWNTLLVEENWHLAHALRVEALRNAAVQCGYEVSRDEAARAFDEAWQTHLEAWREGRATGAREVARDGLHLLEVAEVRPVFQQLIDHFENASHSGRVCALDGAREVLRELRASGVACALICDTGLTPGRVVRRHLERLEMLQYLEVQIFSDEVGIPKPDSRPFEAALEGLGVAPSEALHVGDLRRTDIAGARAMGMMSARICARYDDPHADLPEADFVVHSHAELRALLLA